ncbi:MAG: type IV pili methyl-accepting chemotaxis transducer N-terminal domain-containing protein, partial [Betaproteobacteria bacterium]|nr:type IV pili methyl-accepting chemotaxis transducer N-terminal domain-containing protein [Betaproteobacteria bacterium]
TLNARSVPGTRKLRTKITALVIVFLLLALAAIGLTLVEARKFEGSAAAVNDLGSERMRAYRIAFLASEIASGRGDTALLRSQAVAEVARFEDVLDRLSQGDPARPLFLPPSDTVRRQLDDVDRRWHGVVKPLALGIIEGGVKPAGSALLERYRVEVDGFVDTVNALVLTVEQQVTRDTATLRLLQVALMVLALVASLAMAFLLFHLIVQPVTRLQQSLERIQNGDFAVRLPVDSKDEFGALALGFNRMADHLQGLYRTLEDRVAQKTRSLEQKNRELATLYEIGRLLNEPMSIEDTCRGFLRKLMSITGAAAGAVRLTDPSSRHIHLYLHEGLDPDFVVEERCIEMGECLCGEAAESARPVIHVISPAHPDNVLYKCQKVGYRTVSVFTIGVKRQLLGIFNLYFTGPREFNAAERQLLETLGQHLGVAIENQRLVSRDKELAVTEERNLLAQELHDSIAQSLAFLNLEAQMLEESLAQGNLEAARGELAQIREGIQESYDDVRELLVHFRTRLKQADLEATIRAALQRFEGQTGIRTHFEASGTTVSLAPEVQPQVLHIVQEALSNVRKHARATEVTVEVVRNDGYLFCVRDNGRGFDPATLAERSDTHVGLRIMRERAHRIGGGLEIRAQPDRGTEVALRLPIARAEAA